MKKIIVLMALALGLFACDDGKKDNGGGGNAGLNFGNIKIGDTPTKTFVVKNVLGIPALTEYGTYDVEFSDQSYARFDDADCQRYATTPNINIIEYDLPVGVTCNLKYTLRPQVFARYTITIENTSIAKSNVENTQTEHETIDFIASSDGLAEPNPDVEYKVQQTTGVQYDTKRIDINKNTNEDYLVLSYGPVAFRENCDNFLNTDCVQIVPNRSETLDGCVTGVASDRMTPKVTVPREGCVLKLKFNIKTKAFDYANGFYLRPGTDLTVPLAPNQPVQRYVFKREF